MIVIGDVHGKLDHLKELLDKVDTSKGVCFVGDLIDRGPYSREVVELIRRAGYHTVRGNHEQMVVRSILPLLGEMPRVDRDAIENWYSNGAVETLKSYGVTPEDALSVLTGRKPVPEQLADDARWMARLPYYIEFPDVLDAKGRSLVVSHSGVLPFWEHKDTEQGHEAIIWDRRYSFDGSNVEGKISVFGHTPMREPMFGPDFVCIDTAAFAPTGRLTALDLRTMQIIQTEPNPPPSGRTVSMSL